MAVLIGAALIAGSIAATGRYQISATSYGFMNGDNETTGEAVYRLDRWTGVIESCDPNQQDRETFRKNLKEKGTFEVPCELTQSARDKLAN